MTLVYAAIVEGETEQDSLPGLLERVWYQHLGSGHFLAPAGWVVAPADKLRNQQEFRRDKLLEARFSVQEKMADFPDAVGRIFVFLDAETGGCPAELSDALTGGAAEAIGAEPPVTVFVAKRMLENWIVAGARSLAGRHGFPDDMTPPDEVEDRSGAAWLSSRRREKNPRSKYTKPGDAKPLFRDMDIAEASANSRSFRRFVEKLRGFSTALDPPPAP